ncbi:hypothetical protein PMAYCL1PPCAC_26211, partial [Pristionchus mayeri]
LYDELLEWSSNRTVPLQKYMWPRDQLRIYLMAFRHAADHHSFDDLIRALGDDICRFKPFRLPAFQIQHVPQFYSIDAFVNMGPSFTGQSVLRC